MTDFSELERDVLTEALAAYERQMLNTSAANHDPITNSQTAESARLARRAAIARDLAQRI